MLSGRLPHAYLEPGDFTWMSSFKPHESPALTSEETEAQEDGL